jgi:hypothetical protein
MVIPSLAMGTSYREILEPAASIDYGILALGTGPAGFFGFG